MTAEPVIVDTADGSQTLFVPEYEQTMHTLSGAYSEAVIKHVAPSNVLGYDSDICVLDVGFGLGYNTLALLCKADDSGFEHKINVTALEKDRSVEKFLSGIKVDDFLQSKFDIIKEVYKTGGYSSKRVVVKLVLGDARASLRSVEPSSFDAVFHDPFSPAKNPELWTTEFFRLLHHAMERNAVLTTYSAAAHVRAAMVEAGFSIGKGPEMKPKREGTVAAVKADRIACFTPKELAEILENKRAVPYRDLTLADEKENILARRRQEIKARKKGLH